MQGRSTAAAAFLASCAPEAGNDEYTILEDQVLELEVADNDSRVDAIEILRAEHGKAVTVDGGRIRYEPEADFVGDDLVTYEVTNHWGRAEAEVHVHVQPDNSWFRRTEHGASGQIDDLAAEDIDGDGDRDLILLYGGALVELWRQQDHTFDPARAEVLAAKSMNFAGNQLVIRDVDGDHKLDLLIAGWGLQLLLNRGAAGEPLQFLPVSSLRALASFGVVAADLDLDGNVDLAVRERGAVYWNEGNIDGLPSFSKGPEFGLGTSRVDVWRAQEAFSRPAQDYLLISNSNGITIAGASSLGDRTLEKHLLVQRAPDDLIAVDLDNDGCTDLLTAGGYDDVNEVFPCSEWSDAITLGRGGDHVAVGDYDGDGDLDIAQSVSPSRSGQRRLEFFTSHVGEKSLSFEARGDEVPPGSVQTLKSADLDGDGRAEVVIAYQSPALPGQGVAIYWNVGAAK